jgi:dynein heavy chain 1, cytosolic
MTRDPSSGTASQEINFWISLENALDSIDRQLKSDGVTLTLDVLRQAKRFHATVSFIADTGLKEAAEKVQKYNQLMREFPINELLSATSLDRLQEALILIFGHLTKKLRISPYPIRRALPLVEAISGDLDTQLHNLLSGRRLMHYEYGEFEKLMNASDDVFHTWDDQLKEFTNVAREVTRRRSEKFIPIKIAPRHSATQERLQYLRTFRKAHEQLQRTVANVVEAHENATIRRGGDDKRHFLSESFGDMDAVSEVRQAYEALKDVDVLDLSPGNLSFPPILDQAYSQDGTELWVAAETSYNDRIAQVENAIIARLRERLAKATTANEMFRVFSKYNALFVRPKIRGAIQEYQTQLIENVKTDIASLHDRFKLQYGNSEAHAMAQLRDLPPISGAIIWAKQIERQLNTYMRRVEDVLGKGWELYAEGQKLQNESLIFRKKLDTRAVCTSSPNLVAYTNLSRFTMLGYRMCRSDSLPSLVSSLRLCTIGHLGLYSCKSILTDK